MQIKRQFDKKKIGIHDLIFSRFDAKWLDHRIGTRIKYKESTVDKM